MTQPQFPGPQWASQPTFDSVQSPWGEAAFGSTPGGPALPPPPPPQRRIPLPVLLVIGAVVLAVVSVLGTLAVTGHFSGAKDDDAAAAQEQTSGPQQTSTAQRTGTSPQAATTPVRSSIESLMAKESDFASLTGYRYEIEDLSRYYSPTHSGSLDDCDHLMWPDKDYPAMQEVRSTYTSARPGAWFSASVFDREIPAWSTDFDRLLVGCPRVTITDQDSSNVLTITKVDIPGLSGDHHAYTMTTVRTPNDGSAVTTTSSKRVVAVLRGVTFVVATGSGGDADLSTLYENQRNRILTAP